MQRNLSLHQYVKTRLLESNFADELCLILISQRYDVHNDVLTEGNGYWCTTYFKVLEECNLVFLGMENKIGTLTFLPTKWCTGNHKPVLPVNPSMFQKELQSFLEGKELKNKTPSTTLQISPDFLKKKSTRRLGKYTIWSGKTVTMRSMNSLKLIGTITILPESTQEKLCTPKNSTFGTAEMSSMHQNTLLHWVKIQESMDLDIGQINCHLSNVNKTLLQINTTDTDISDGQILKNVENLVSYT